MSTKCKGICLVVAVMVATLFSCGNKVSEANLDELDLLLEDSIPVETLTKEEEELGLTEEKTPLFDGIFNDFLFAYLHSPTLREERTAKPLRLEHAARPTEILEERNPEVEYSLQDGVFIVTLYIIH